LLSDLISPHEPVFTPKRGFRETFRVFLSNRPDGLSSYFAGQFIRSRQRFIPSTRSRIDSVPFAQERRGTCFPVPLPVKRCQGLTVWPNDRNFIAHELQFRSPVFKRGNQNV
jgi:hypothetical protein